MRQMQQHNEAEIKQFLQGQKKEYQRSMDEVRKVGHCLSVFLRSVECSGSGVELRTLD